MEILNSMKKIVCVLCLCVISVYSEAQANKSDDKDKKAILAVLKAQRLAWSNDDLEGFMEGYWKSDSLAFGNSHGVAYGWDKTLENYKKGYPTKEHTGKLNFKINAISKINENAYYVIGEYHIKREVGNADGYFMVIFKRINGEWKIIADTSM